MAIQAQANAFAANPSEFLKMNIVSWRGPAPENQNLYKDRHLACTGTGTLKGWGIEAAGKSVVEKTCDSIARVNNSV